MDKDRLRNIVIGAALIGYFACGQATNKYKYLIVNYLNLKARKWFTGIHNYPNH